MFVPAGNSSKAIPRGLCKVCLFTGFTEGSNCRHSTVNSWKKSYCESGRMHYMLCRECPRHQLGHQWWKDHHNPQLGYKNYVQIISDLTFDKVQASINVITVNKIEGDITSRIEKICKLSQVEAQNFNIKVSTPVRTNNIPVGGTTIPSEMVKVKYNDRNTLIQVFYDKGSQLSLVNKY